MQTNRAGRDAAFAQALRAGTMASRNGSAMVTPTPLRTARRERGFCVMYMIAGLAGLAIRCSLFAVRDSVFGIRKFAVRLDLLPLSRNVSRAAIRRRLRARRHPERRAVHDTEDVGRHSMLILRRV